MQTEIFGESITYYNSETIFKDNLSRFVKTNGFSTFSPEGITSYLTYRHPIGEYTMFSDIKKLPFGTKSNEKQNRTTFWFPDFTPNNATINEAIEKIDKLLKKSILRLVESKNKIAITLSGGIDSSLIVAIVRYLFPKREIYTYSAGFYGNDEFEYSRQVSKKYKTTHKKFVLEKKHFLEEHSMLDDLINFKSAPLHPNELPLAYIEKVAKEDGMDIVLCGEGSDDIFGGYGQNLRMYLNYDYKKSFFEFFLDNYRYFSLKDRRKIIRDEYLVNDIDLTLESIEPYELDFDFRNWTLYFIQKLHTPGLITRGANAMRYNGFELGFPFINIELVNYTNSLPFDYKVRWKKNYSEQNMQNIPFREISEKYDIPKYIIKKVSEKYLPNNIIYRQKKGFPVPFEFWLKDLKTWNFNEEIFKTNDISSFSGWKKFMLINLDKFINQFINYQKGSNK